MSAGTDMSAKDADSKLDSAAHGGCPATTCYASSCGRVTLYLGDSSDIAATLRGVDTVVTDPPYGFGAYATDDDRPVIECLQRWDRKAVFGYPETLVKWCMGLGVPDEWVTWWPTNKPTTRVGKGKLPKSSESIAIWGDCDAEKAKIKRVMDRTIQAIHAAVNGKEDGDMARMPDVWRDPSPGIGFNSHLRNHPNEKPISLMVRLVEVLGGETILDPYMGSGTTGIACIRTGRRFIGIEKDPTHYATALERIKNELAQGDLFLGHNA
jgi:DNA modification methylase